MLLPGPEVSCYSANVKARLQSTYQSRRDVTGLDLVSTYSSLLLEKKVKTREACNGSSSAHSASVCNVKSKAVSLSCCSLLDYNLSQTTEMVT